jgi:hypothetical protein
MRAADDIGNPATVAQHVFELGAAGQRRAVARQERIASAGHEART